MAEEARKGLSRMSRPHEVKAPEAKGGIAPKAPKVEGEGETGVKTHTIEEHSDGHMTSHMHDGTSTEHPHHLHMMAHLGHHMTGGDKHHVAHHDGMGVTSHGIHESGEHDGPHEHADGNEAASHFGQFMSDEGAEPHANDGMGEESEMEPSYGGMGGM